MTKRLFLYVQIFLFSSTFLLPVSVRAAVTRQAFIPIQAESANWAARSRVFAGCCIGYFYSTGWQRYDRVDFGSGARSVSVRVALPKADARQRLEFRLDSLGGPVVARLFLQGTGSWSTYEVQTAEVKEAAGIHTLYVVGWSDDQEGIANVDWIQFGRGTTSPAAESGTVSSAVSWRTPMVQEAVSKGRVIHVPKDGNLQRTINEAKPGDTITLAAGATYKGPITLPKKEGNEWITIRTDAPDASLPPAGERMTPAYAAKGILPKMTANNGPALQTAVGAHHYRILGVEFTKETSTANVYQIIALGEASGSQTRLDQVAHHLVLDRVYIHGGPNGEARAETRRGIGLNSAHTDIIDSYIADIKRYADPGLSHAQQTKEAQGIAGWNGPGPFNIVNNYIEGSTQNIFFGGESTTIPNLIPSDIVIRGNTFRKPAFWAGTYTVKNVLELKNAQRVLIEGNVLDMNGADGKASYAVLFTPRNQNGDNPWATVRDVRMVNNTIKNAGNGVFMISRDDNHSSTPAKNILIKNNLFLNITGKDTSRHGRFLALGDYKGGIENLAVEGNTVFQNGPIAFAWGPGTSSMVFRGNIVNVGGGIIGEGKGEGLETLKRYYPGIQMTGNILIGGDAAKYPAGNYFPSTMGEVGFRDVKNGDYRLSTTSAYAK
jgi:hypothetical protein